jgi:hypothetical protein
MKYEKKTKTKLTWPGNQNIIGNETNGMTNINMSLRFCFRIFKEIIFFVCTNNKMTCLIIF